MKTLLSVAALVGLGACASVQPSQQCDFDPSQTIIKQRECRDDRGNDSSADSGRPVRGGSDAANHSGGNVSNTKPDRSEPSASGWSSSGRNDTRSNSGGGGSTPDHVKDKPKDDKPKDDKPKGKAKGNASANNGKGGNYSKTGHVDNGKGNGKGRR